MPIRTYLCNQFYDKKCRLNGIQPSTRLPWKEKLCQYFSDHIQLSNDQPPPKVDLRSAMTPVEDQSRIGSWLKKTSSFKFYFSTANSLAGKTDFLDLYIPIFS